MMRTSAREDRSVLVVGVSGKLVGVDATTGEIRWTNELKGSGYGIVEFAISGNTIVATAEQGPAVHFVDYATGETRATVRTSSQGRATIVCEGQLVCIARNGYVDAFDLEGTQLWQQPLQGMGTGRLALGFPDNVRAADDAGSS